MGAYDKIFNVSLVVAVVMICLTAFLGLYIPEVGASVNNREVKAPLGSQSISMPVGLQTYDDNFWMPVENYTFTFGGQEFQIAPYENSHTAPSYFKMRIIEDNNLTTYDSVRHDLIYNKYFYYEAYANINPPNVYISVENAYNNWRTNRSVLCENIDNASHKENVSVGHMWLRIYWGNKPFKQFGFRDVVFGLFSFNIPLIPDVFSNIISSVFLFSIAFVTFAIAVKVAPFVG